MATGAISRSPETSAVYPKSHNFGYSAWASPDDQSIWQAPLVPAALALTAGILTDRYASMPLLFSISVILAGLVAWAVTRLGRPTNLGLMYLALAGAAFGAAYHHWQRDTYAADDIGNFATIEPHPARLRGVIVREPEIIWHPVDNPL